MEKGDENTGRAYSFFYSSASEDELKRGILNARHVSRTPEPMGLELAMQIDPMHYIFGDNELYHLSKQAIEEGTNRVIAANLPGATNKKTAEELRDVMTYLYSDGDLQDSFHKDGKPYFGAVVYRDDKSYQFLD